MLTEQELISLPDPIQRQFRLLERHVVGVIATHISRIGTIPNSELSRLDEMQRVGFNIAQIERQIARTVNRSEGEVQALLMEAARREYNGVRRVSHLYQTSAQTPMVPFNENRAAQTLVNQVSNATVGRWRNIANTHTIGMITSDGAFQPLPVFYQTQIDQAIIRAMTGEDWQQASIRTIRHMSDGGIRRMSWSSGYTLRVDTAVRRNIFNGLAELNRQQSELIAQEINADGMEITWHDGYRPTHDFGGQQFPMDKYRKEILPLMQEINCYHRAFAIVLGVSTPAYTEEELAAMKLANEREWEWEGETFTMYTAQQRQREFEASIRQAQDRINGFEAGGHHSEVTNERIRLNQLMDAYTNFSEGVGLKPSLQRIAV